MSENLLKHVNRQLTPEERARHAQIRAAAMQDIPPKAESNQALHATYGIEEHRHRFSVWAAARATQRKFAGATVEKLRRALERSGVRVFLNAPDAESVNEACFEQLHRSWCREIVSGLEEAGLKDVPFGRAAKLIAVYLKSMVVLGPRLESNLARIAHPPIDRILLSRVAESPAVDSLHKREWANTSWTQLSEDRYYRLIGQLREILPQGAPFWMIEQYWTVTDE